MIRDFKKEDLQAVFGLVKAMAQFHHQIDPYYKTSEEMTDLKSAVKNWLRKVNYKVLVAEIDGRVMGYVRGSVQKAPYFARARKIGVVDDLFIEESFRRRNFGEELFGGLLKWFKQKGVRELWLSVDIRNNSAINFWEKTSFHKFTLKMRRDLDPNML